MSCRPAGTSDRPVSMPMQACRVRRPTCSRWQQQPRPASRRRAEDHACCRCPGVTLVRASAGARQSPPAPVASALAVAAALPVLLDPSRPAGAADGLPAATGAQSIVSGSDAVVGAGERAVASAAQAVTASATGASLTDNVTTALFFAAVAALSAITLGVLYLTVVSWFDDRREKDDRQKFNQSVATRGKAGTPQSSKPKTARKPVSARGGGKGFGS